MREARPLALAAHGGELSCQQRPQERRSRGEKGPELGGYGRTRSREWARGQGRGQSLLPHPARVCSGLCRKPVTAQKLGGQS